MTSAAIGGFTTDVIGYALDGLSLRHAAIASNIANANSPAFRPREVRFEAQLSALLSQQRAGSTSGTGAGTGYPPPPLVTESLPRAGLTGQRTVEAEIVRLNQNVVQYQALIKGLEKHMASLSTAINEGRR